MLVLGITDNIARSDYFYIAKSEATSGAVASLDFSSIPQDYTHLEIRLICQNTATANSSIRMRFNGDSGATNYSFHYSYYDSTTNSTSSTTGAGSFNIGVHTTTASADASMTVIQLQNYANTNIYKSISHFNHQNGGTQQIRIGGGTWKSGTAISSISLFPDFSNFSQYSVAYLYGIK